MHESPHVGRFSNRIKRLRHRIVRGLGEELFDEAYKFLKDKLVLPADDGGDQREVEVRSKGDGVGRR